MVATFSKMDINPVDQSVTPLEWVSQAQNSLYLYGMSNLMRTGLNTAELNNEYTLLT